MFFVLIIFREWVVVKGYLTSGDWVFYYREQLKEFGGFPQLWQTFSGLGSVDLVPAFDIFKFLYAFFSNYVDYSISERILYFWPAFIFAPIFSYYFLSKIFKNKAAVIIGVFVYIFNTYFLLLSTGDITIMVAYTFLPIIFYYFKLTLEERTSKNAIIVSLLLFASSIYEPRVTYITLLILFLFCVFKVATEKLSFSSVSKIAIYAALPVILMVFLSMFWLLPITKIGALTTNSLFVRQLFGNEFLNISYALTLFHPYWTGGLPAIFIAQPIPFYFWMIPFLAFGGVVLNRKDKNILFFCFVSLFGILLTKQVGIPFSGFYEFLYDHFPGFNAFREASKFYIIIAFGYSVLIGSFFEFIWNKWKRNKWDIYGKYILTILVGFLFLFNTLPFATHKMGTLFVQRTVPSDYLVTKKFIDSQSDYFRTLWVPVTSRWAISTNSHPAISTVDTINSSWAKVLTFTIKENAPEGKVLINFFNSKQTSNLLALSSIKYVFVPLEDKQNDDDFFTDYRVSRKYYIDELNKIPYLRKINIGTKQIVVYQNSHFRPQIYVTNEKETVKRDIPYEDISYKTISSTEYTFTLRVKKPVYMNFSESYHPDWNIRVGDFNWLSAITKKNYSLSANDHFENDAVLNSFYIDPSSVCKEFSCKRNSDGSFDISGTLYFRPEGYIYIGVLISGITFILIIGWLVFDFGKKFRRKK